jgi:flavin-dependent dehydrogenase
MTKPTVLISGAGIAGPALAYWFTTADAVELPDYPTCSKARRA